MFKRDEEGVEEGVQGGMRKAHGGMRKRGRAAGKDWLWNDRLLAKITTGCWQRSRQATGRDALSDAL